MNRSQPPRSILKTIIALTLCFIVAQITVLGLHAMVSSKSLFEQAAADLLTDRILQSRIFLTGLLQFLGSQLLIYALLIGILWYLAVAISELFAFNARQTRWWVIALCSVSFLWIITANFHFAPHSFFANEMRRALLSDPLMDTPIRYTFTLTSWILVMVFTLAVAQMLFQLTRHQHRLRHGIALGIVAILCIANLDSHHRPNNPSVATTTKPNIIFIGIDALRPDFVGFYNKSVTTTPHLDTFLRSGTRFTTAYTTLPRTFPSWTSILTGRYPKHHGARGNNTDLSELNLQATLPKTLQAAGYETIYSTDDTRFNNTDERFGFDRVVTPPMGLNDFVFGTLNDFPLSNLVTTLRMGRWLFPYNYANHGTPVTYAPDNYLDLLTDALNQPHDKPLFLAIHFTVTHWPFYWFNDHLTTACGEACRYQAGIAMADYQVGRLLDNLAANHLLDHAVVVLLSDHGVSLGLHGDRVTSRAHYHGNPDLLHRIPLSKYAGVPDLTVDFDKDYGIDTAHGYGGDILSLTQYHSLLAVKGYGIPMGPPHSVSERILLHDVAPTLLDFLALPPLAAADGISLKNHLLTPDQPALQPHRVLFLETSFSLPDIEKEGISVETVLNKSLKLFQMDAKTGLISIKRKAEAEMNLNKQEAILMGDWFLSTHPGANQSTFTHDAHPRLVVSELPSYLVLVNLTTGDWTMELNQGFALQAPVKNLAGQLYTFYGNEIPPITSD